jgi:hypothetical protein
MVRFPRRELMMETWSPALETRKGEISSIAPSERTARKENRKVHRQVSKELVPETNGTSTENEREESPEA